MLLKDFVENYHHHIWSTGGDHGKLQLQRMRHVIEGLGENMKITDVRLMHIQDFIMTLNCAASTKNQYISAISKVLHYAQQNQLIDYVPPFKGLYDKKLNQRKRVLNEAEILRLKQFFNRAGERWMAHMVTLADQTGLRKGSILEIGRPPSWLRRKPCSVYTDAKNGDEVMVPLNDTDSIPGISRLRSNYGDRVPAAVG